MGLAARVTGALACAIALLVFAGQAAAYQPYPVDNSVPAAPEVSAPQGAHLGEPPRGVMLLVHGGGWLTLGANSLVYERPDARRFARRGWLVHNIDYRPAPWALHDVLAYYDRLHARYRKLPICVAGDSSGGNIALMVAALRPSVACAISHAGPTDLVDFPAGLVDGYIVRYVDPYMSRRAWSPTYHVPGLRRTRVVLAYATNDPGVPYSQGAELAAVDPRAKLFTLRSGTAPFVHSDVDGAQLRAEHAYELRLLTSIARRGH